MAPVSSSAITPFPFQACPDLLAAVLYTAFLRESFSLRSGRVALSPTPVYNTCVKRIIFLFPGLVAASPLETVGGGGVIEISGTKEELTVNGEQKMEYWMVISDGWIEYRSSATRPHRTLQLIQRRTQTRCRSIPKVSEYLTILRVN